MNSLLTDTRAPGVLAGLEGKEDPVVGNHRKRDTCSTGAGCLDKPCPAVIGKADLISSEFQYLQEEISKQSAEGKASWFGFVFTPCWLQ